MFQTPQSDEKLKFPETGIEDDLIAIKTLNRPSKPIANNSVA